jgi:hypothetical protein
VAASSRSRSRTALGCESAWAGRATLPAAATSTSLSASSVSQRAPARNDNIKTDIDIFARLTSWGRGVVSGLDRYRNRVFDPIPPYVICLYSSSELHVFIARLSFGDFRTHSLRPNAPLIATTPLLMAGALLHDVQRTVYDRWPSSASRTASRCTFAASCWADLRTGSGWCRR